MSIEVNGKATDKAKVKDGAAALPEGYEVPDQDQHVTVSELRADLATAVNKVAFGKERIIVVRQGKPVAALVPIEDVEALELLEDKWLAAEADKAMAEPGESIPWEQIKRENGL